jgi:hypothetical protein
MLPFQRDAANAAKLSNRRIPLSYILESWKEAKMIALTKPGKDPKSPPSMYQNNPNVH